MIRLHVEGHSGGGAGLKTSRFFISEQGLSACDLGQDRLSLFGFFFSFVRSRLSQSVQNRFA